MNETKICADCGEEEPRLLPALGVGSCWLQVTGFLKIHWQMRLWHFCLASEGKKVKMG